MKIFLLFFISLTIISFPQQKTTNSILQLENQAKQNLNSQVKNQPTVFASYDESKKSVGLGIIYSLLLPGMGELYAGSYNVGKYFTIAEGLLWGTYIGMNTYAGWKKDNYKSFAAQHAGVDNSNKDADYYGTISDYSDIDSYNNEKALDRDFEALYDRNQYFWKWQSAEERKTYRAMWTSSEQTYNDLRFIVGGMILNRVASAINAVRLIASYNNRLEEELGWNVSVGFKNTPNLPTSVTLNFTSNF
jgi:hypothetical protein